MLEDTKKTEETQEKVHKASKGRDRNPYCDTDGYIFQKADADFLKLCLESKHQEKKTF